MFKIPIGFLWEAERYKLLICLRPVDQDSVWTSDCIFLKLKKKSTLKYQGIIIYITVIPLCNY